MLSYTIQDHLARDGTSHSDLGPPMSITNQENTLSTEQVYGEEIFSQLIFPIPRCLGLCQVDKKPTDRSHYFYVMQSPHAHT